MSLKPLQIVLPPEFHPVQSDIPWTMEQKLISSHCAVKNQRQPLMVNSLAGTGKTSSTLFSVNTYMSWAHSILLTAFGRDAADQMQPKIKHPGARAMNFHRIGYAALAAAMPPGKNGGKLKLDLNSKQAKYKFHDLADQWLESKGVAKDDEERGNLRDTFLDMTTMIRLNMIDPTDTMALRAMCATYGLRPDPEIFAALPAAIAASDKLGLEQGLIDFTDMIYLPVKFNMQFPQYEVVIVDEAQDLSLCTMLMTLRSVKPGGFFMAIGDPRQSIMMFAGAVSNGWEKIRELAEQHLGVKPRELKMTICQRCPVSVLREVNRLYPEIDIRAREGAPEGELLKVSATQFGTMAKAGDIIESRFNRPLVDLYFEVARAGGIPFFKNMSDGLGKRMSKIWDEVRSMPGFAMEKADVFVSRYRRETVAVMEKKKADPYKIGDFEDACDCLEAVIEGSRARTDVEVDRALKLMTERKPGPECITLTSIHRVKGGEAENVFMLDPEGSLPFPGRKPEEQNAEQEQQERNIHYVALTRAKSRLIINTPQKVEGKPADPAQRTDAERDAINAEIAAAGIAGGFIKRSDLAKILDDSEEELIEQSGGFIEMPQNWQGEDLHGSVKYPSADASEDGNFTNHQLQAEHGKLDVNGWYTPDQPAPDAELTPLEKLRALNETPYDLIGEAKSHRPTRIHIDDEKLAALRAQNPFRVKDTPYVQNGKATPLPLPLPMDIDSDDLGLAELQAMQARIQAKIDAKLKASSPIEDPQDGNHHRQETANAPDQAGHGGEIPGTERAGGSDQEKQGLDSQKEVGSSS